MSDINKFPTKLNHIAKLQVFDITNSLNLKEIYVKGLSSLADLEELENCATQWIEGQGNIIRKTLFSVPSKLTQN